MKDPTWLLLEAVQVMHEESIRLFGGSTGIRDEGMLLSAMARPQNIWAYEGPVPLSRLAGAYAAGIILNHPFIDGNKRTGFLAAYTFLDINGQILAADEVDATLMTLNLAAREIEEADFTAWIETKLELKGS